MDKELAARLEGLKLEHAALMQQLYEGISQNICGKEWSAMSDDDCMRVVEAASKLCRSWDENPDLRNNHTMGGTRTVDLIAQQHQITQQIIAVENEIIAGLKA